MFFFPYGTDAPVYYWPYTTVTLIALNAVLFVAVLVNPGLAALMVLDYGDGLHPAQWITSIFLHGGIMHLVGNMLFLWAFGLIIEGKLGWYKTAILYLGMGVFQCAAEQFVLQHSTGGSYGASGVVFGFMAMALVWAPESKIDCVAVFIFGFYFRVTYFEIRVFTLVGLYLLLQIVIVWWTEMQMSSEMLHLIGAAVGLPIAIAMIRWKLVDCDYFDIFSVWSGRNLLTREEREAEEANTPQRRRQAEEAARNSREFAVQEMRQVMKTQPQLALKAHERMSQKHPDWSLSEGDHLQLIQALHQKNLFRESMPLMGEYLAKHLEKRILVRLKLAQILVVQEKRPAQALAVLAKLNRDGLDPRCREFYDKIKAQAERVRAANPYDWVEHDW